MSILLFAIGIVWGLVGLSNIIFSESWQTSGSNMQALVIVFNFVVFILPALVLAGIAKLISNKRP